MQQEKQNAIKFLRYNYNQSDKWVNKWMSAKLSINLPKNCVENKSF